MALVGDHPTDFSELYRLFPYNQFIRSAFSLFLMRVSQLAHVRVSAEQVLSRTEDCWLYPNLPDNQLTEKNIPEH